MLTHLISAIYNLCQFTFPKLTFALNVVDVQNLISCQRSVVERCCLFKQADMINISAYKLFIYNISKYTSRDIIHNQGCLHAMNVIHRTYVPSAH